MLDTNAGLLIGLTWMFIFNGGTVPILGRPPPPPPSTPDYLNLPCMLTAPLSMLVNGVPVFNGATVYVKPGDLLNADCSESSAEGTHLYFQLNDRNMDDSVTSDGAGPVNSDDGSRPFSIRMSVNASDDLHLKPLRCVAEHAPSNCFEAIGTVIQVN